jgi:sulfur transfer complex TusBCD TusB component (DsrH family)
MKLVDFFIIGAQKAGTTSAAYHLNQHENIYIPDHEIHYFDKEFLEFIPVDYHALYGPRLSQKYCGDKTPSYAYLPFSIRRIHSYNPQAKLIFILREPITRAFSQWNMAVQTGKRNDDFLRSVMNTPLTPITELTSNGYNILQRGFYIDQIKEILRYFNIDQVFILISEKIKVNPLFHYNEILSFIGAGPLNHFAFQSDIHSREYVRKISRDEVLFLFKIYREYNLRLYDFLGYEIQEWEQYYKSFLK